MREPAEANLSIGELLQKLAAETSLLVRQEIDLARAEIACAVAASGKPAVSFGVAGLFAVGTFGALTALLIAAIATALPLWGAALVVTILYGAIAAVAATVGRNALKNVKLVPTQTITTIKDDVQSVRSSIKRSH